MRLTVQNMNQEDQIFQIEIEDDGTIEDIKILISVETNLAVEEQVLIYNGKVAANDQMKAKLFGLNNDDMVMITSQQALMGMGMGMGAPNMFGRPPQQQMRQQQHPTPSANPNDANLLSNFFQDLSKPVRTQRNPLNAMNAQLDMVVRQKALQTKEYYLSNQTQLNYILHQDPELAGAIVSEDDEKLFQILKKRISDQMERKKKEAERIHRLNNADVLDIEAQKQIEEEIRQQMVNENYEMAQENYPEFFGQITMLYIKCKVNGNEIQAFVDSGAQSTIISRPLAEKLGLMKLIDTRFAGTAIGIGTQKILGRIHAANMEIQGKVFVCSLVVLEGNKVDFLFGLDNLKRHLCNIDLVQNMLHMRNGEISVPFLSEGEIEKNDMEEEKQALFEKQKSMGSKFNESDVKELMEVSGMSKAQVEEALVINDGNKEHAAAYLMNQSMARKSPKRQ